MVATRRGVRVTNPAKTSPDPPSDVPATPSAGRRTRRTAQEADNAAQTAPEETSRQTDANSEQEAPGSPAPSIKRCTRASRLHSPEQPCTPVGSTHEADVSDLESCCSVLSDMELPVTRSRGRRRQPRAASREDEEISEVESVSSAVSASKVGQINRRSTRRRAAPEVPDPADDGTDVKVTEPESFCSVVSESRRVTRSQRKTRTTFPAKQEKEDSEVSDADSCMSCVSGAEVSSSTTRRATRSRKKTHPILINLDETSDCSGSPAGRQTRATRAKATASVEGSEPPSCDSEGFESGPTYSMTTRLRSQRKSTAPKTIDSDSELTDVHSPMSSPTRSRGTPCSSRTGSWNSSRGAPGPRSSTNDLSIVLEKVGEPSEEDSSLNASRLESTVITDDADCTLLEEQQSSATEEKEDTNTADIATNDAATESVKKDVVSESAVMAKDQQEEQSAQNKDEDTSEMEKMQEMIQSSEPLKASQSVTVTIWEKASEITEEKGKDMEVADEDAHPPEKEQAVDEDAVMETLPHVEEGMEVSSLNTDAKQVVDAGKSIQLTSHKQNRITVDSDSEEQPKDVIVQSKKVISLLDSSDEEDEYDEEEEREVSGEEEEEERGGPSQKSEEASASVDGLFMIDTRPGQEADDQYYTERPAEQAKSKEAGLDDDEFVDEEGDDDDDDVDAKMLFWSRNPQLKEMSSRIDPGIGVKELGGLYINFDGSKSKPVCSSLQKLKDKKIQDEVMKKSVIGPDFEKKEAVPPYSESKQALKLKRREERQKSTGDGWFNMKAPEISQELKGDLQVLKMRGSMDSKRFYKKNDRDGFPKYFQIGTVVDNPVDFYHSRIPKKERKRTMVEELVADAEFRHKNKKKYQQILTEKSAKGAGKRNKKKNKFHKK
ncbi:deoxynucleotidyltransferase terminal-interacting protein 2 [Echeneis naucrates]|uniref:Fcf2 pre-rRNA processing C-terminal domain-containing protein n=1 Tax=Echeneis naucrates TaxID=173247 RepID=A0A665VCX4_ECHNA|nr:deoxynucleotidyltransferase terminal-interacting protein 2 [Echeneis naucrates]